MKILFITAEVAPFAKAGGLADVCGALPKELRSLGHDVRVIMPAYSNIQAAKESGKWPIDVLFPVFYVPARNEWLPAAVLKSTLPGTDVPVYFVSQEDLFDRPNLYGYGDDPYRFAFFSRAALLLSESLQWHPDVIHAHDWHAAPTITWLGTTGQAAEWYRGIASVYTIHNLGHQGHVQRDIFAYLGVSSPPLHEEGDGAIVNFMARGIYHATMINTVSPNYAREIMTPEGGSGLHGLLRFRHYDVHGIINGLDTNVWNPSIDPHLTAHFDADHIQRRQENKLALQQRLEMPRTAEVPLFAMVTRLDRQKGLEITGHALHLLLNSLAGEAQVVILGSGMPEYEAMLAHLASYHWQKMRVVFGYMPDLAPLIYGGSDIFLMPSLFEPCGLGQMIAMRYGSVPLVRATGGLADTVRDGVTGFVFQDYSSDDLWNTMRRALYVYHNDRESWHAIQHAGMLSDFSWRTSAIAYQQLYEWAVNRVLMG